MSRQTATAGAVTQMAAQGLADAVLTGNPQVTFWRFVAKAYTNFALESQLLDYTAGQPYFGSFPKCNLDRIGDLVYWMYAVFDLPGIGSKYRREGYVLSATGPEDIPDTISPVDIVGGLLGANSSATATVSGGEITIVNAGNGDYTDTSATMTIGGNDYSVTLVLGPLPDTPELLASGLYAPYWTNAVGQALIESANFFIGGQNIDYMRGEFLFIWEELSGQPGKRLTEMIGRYPTALFSIRASEQPRRLYVPLPFWFTLNSGLALPLVSLQFHSVAVSIKIRDLNSLLKFSPIAMAAPYSLSINSDVYIRNYFNPDSRDDSQAVLVGDDAGAPAAGTLSNLIQNSDLNGFIEVCYVYLDQRERSKFADGAFEQLMIEHQDTNTQVNYNVSVINQYAGNDRKIQYEINFNHTIIELYWVARLGAREAWQGQNQVGLYNGLYNDWFNFSGGVQAYGPTLYDPVQSVQLLLNNASRFGDVEGRYFRLVQPWQHHTNIPGEASSTFLNDLLGSVITLIGGLGPVQNVIGEYTGYIEQLTNAGGKFIYSYSFALQPEDVQPSGSCNFSRIDNTKLNVTLDRHIFYGPSNVGTEDEPVAGNDGNGTVTFMVFATNWNILRFKYGLGGKRFAN